MLRVVVLGAAAGGGVPQWNCGCPVCQAARTKTPRTSEHAGLDCRQRRRRPLVPDQCLAGSAPAIDRDAAASSRPRQTSSLADLRRDPDQRRNRCDHGAIVDARGIAIYDLRACQSARDIEVQQRLQRAQRKERQAAGNRDRSGVRAETAGRVALRHRDPALRGDRQGRVVSRRRAARGRKRPPAIRSAFASATRQRANSSIFSPLAPR